MVNILILALIYILDFMEKCLKFKKGILLLSVALFVSSCVPDFSKSQTERLYFKKIETPSAKIDWFQYSLLTSMTSDYVLISKGSKIDTICVSDNIHDVNILIGDTIIISFYGHPKDKNETIKIKEKVLDCKILIDTNFRKEEIKYRSTFKDH